MNQPFSTSTTETRALRSKVAKSLLWLGIISIIMVFAGLTSGYVVSRGRSSWMYFELPLMFWYSTFTIVASSVSLFWAGSSAKKNKLKQVTLGIFITLLLGVLFAVFQFRAWSELTQNNVFFAGKMSNVAGSYLYVLSGLHLLHLAGGLIALLVMLFKSLKLKYDDQNLLGLQLGSIYWHFLDFLWIYLFLFLLLFR